VPEPPPAPPSSGRSRLSGTAAWNVIDQALASLATFVVTIIAAAAGTAQGFGSFALALTVYLFLLGVSQAMVNQVYLMHYPGVPGESETHAGARAAAGLAAVFGAGCAVVVAPVALVVAADAGPSIATIALLFPLLFVQEAWRGILVGLGRPRSAAFNDGLRAVLQIGVMGALVATGHTESPELILGWGLAGGAAAVLGALQVGRAPSPAGGLRFARRHIGVARFLVAEWVMVLGAAQLGLLVVAWLGAVPDVGALRGAQTLLGPMNVLGLGVFGFLLTELVRRPGLPIPRRRKVAAAAGGVLAAVAIGWGLLLTAAPDRVGELLLGDTWADTSTVLLPMTFYVAGAAAATGVLAVLRSVGDARSTFVVNCVLGPLMLLSVMIGQISGGIVGAAWGFAASTVLVLPLFWVRMEVVLRRPGIVRDDVTRVAS
jgi:O-antigen/teichoic acid export membrane protein